MRHFLSTVSILIIDLSTFSRWERKVPRYMYLVGRTTCRNCLANTLLQLPPVSTPFFVLYNPRLFAYLFSRVLPTLCFAFTSSRSIYFLSQNISVQLHAAFLRLLHVHFSFWLVSLSIQQTFIRAFCISLLFEVFHPFPQPPLALFWARYSQIF